MDPAQPGHSIETHTWGHEGHRGQRLEQGDAGVDPAQPGHSIETHTWGHTGQRSFKGKSQTSQDNFRISVYSRKTTD